MRTTACHRRSARRGRPGTSAQRVVSGECVSPFLLGAVGHGLGDAFVGGFQGTVQGGYDLGLIGLDVMFGLRLSDTFKRDLFGAPTSSWQAVGRVVIPAVGLPLPAKGASVVLGILGDAATAVRSGALADELGSVRLSFEGVGTFPGNVRIRRAPIGVSSGTFPSSIRTTCGQIRLLLCWTRFRM